MRVKSHDALLSRARNLVSYLRDGYEHREKAFQRALERGKFYLAREIAPGLDEDIVSRLAERAFWIVLDKGRAEKKLIDSMILKRLALEIANQYNIKNKEVEDTRKEVHEYTARYRESLSFF